MIPQVMKLEGKTLGLWTMLLLLLVTTGSATGKYILDHSFGSGGKVTTSLGGLNDRGYGIAVQSDGKLIIAGSRSSSADYDFALARFLADGSPDTGFNFDGRVTTPVGRYNDEAFAVDLLEDGRIIAAGYSTSETDRDFALACYNKDGSLDFSFGQDGVVVTQVGGSHDEITALVVDENDRIVVAGVVEGTKGRVIGVVRYLNNGALDASFGEDGISLIGIGEDAVAQGILVQPGGRIVVSGTFLEQEAISSFLLGITESGAMDGGFGADGIAVPLDGTGTNEGYGITSGADNLIYMAGAIEQEGNLNGVLYRFTGDGRPDTGFHTMGYAVLVKGPEEDALYDVKITRSGQVVAGGYTTENGVKRFLLVTYEGSSADALTQASGDRGDEGSIVEEPIRISTLRIVTEESFEDEQPVVRLRKLEVLESYEVFQSASVLHWADPSIPVSSDGLSGIKGLKLMVDRIVDAISDFLVAPVAAEEVSVETETGSTVAVDFEEGGTEGAALAVTEDGKVVVVGTASDGGTDSLAVAQFTEDAVAVQTSDAATSSLIITKEATEITRTGAITGGEILSGLGGVTKRGVVFSIAQDPVLKDSDSEGGDSSSLTVSITNPSSGAEITEASVTLSATTSAEATCGYNQGSDIGFESMTKFPGSSATSHSVEITGLTDGDYTYYVRCQTTDALEGVSSVQFSVAISVTSMIRDLTRGAGNFLVADAHAQDEEETEESTGLFGSSSDEDFVEEGNTEDGAGVGRYSSILENLKPGTRFYVRAYAVVSGSVLYGNQVTFRTSDSCFIATASFGSILHPYVRTLRDFRDRFMVPNAVGSALVELYYKISPPIADRIAANPLLRAMTRLLLLPCIGFSWLALQIGLAASAVLIVGTIVLGGYAGRNLLMRSGKN